MDVSCEGFFPLLVVDHPLSFVLFVKGLFLQHPRVEGIHLSYLLLFDLFHLYGVLLDLGLMVHSF